MASLSKRVGTPKAVSLSKKRRAAVKEGLSSKLSLENILGLTCHSSNSLAVSDSCIAYPAGNIAILLGLKKKKKNKQLHILNKKAVSCLALSPSGNYLAIGECGRDPCVHVWQLGDEEKEPYSLVNLKGHDFGIQCVAFSSGQKYLVSIGYNHDRQVIIWNWKNGTKFVHGKFAQAVNAVAFSHDHTSKLGNSYFVSVHHRRLQFWYYNTPSSKDGAKKMTSNILKSRSAILGDLQDSTFVGVACGRGVLSQNTYALTKSGKLCLFDNKRVLDKFTEVKISPALCLTLNDSYLFCAGSDGVIRLFDPCSLDYIITLPLPHPLGVDVWVSAEPREAQDLDYPDAVAMVINNNKLSVVYVDHSLYVWDISNIRQVGKQQSWLYHNACIWDIAMYPRVQDETKRLLPDSSFITCSSDGTVRFWCLDPTWSQWNLGNLYSKDLLRVIYRDLGNNNFLTDNSSLPGDASVVADTARGVRSIDIRPDGRHIAVGDRKGIVMVYDLEFLDNVYEEVAHDAEVLSLSFSKEVEGVYYLASASRDRMVHIFTNNETKGYEPIQSLPDHSASVTSISFVRSTDQKLQLLSCGADKSILYHVLDKLDSEVKFYRANHVVSKTAIYDMAVDAQDKHFFTSGSDRFLRMYSVSSGKKLNIIKAPTGDEGSMLKVTLDPSGLYVATSCADKTILLFDVSSGECISRHSGHSEVVTQLKFSQDCRYLYTVSGDSCIFVWRLAQDLTQTMHKRLAEMGQPVPFIYTEDQPDSRATYTCSNRSQPLRGVGGDATVYSARPIHAYDPPSDIDTESVSGVEFDFRLSMLPKWAQKVALSRPSLSQQVPTVHQRRTVSKKEENESSKMTGGKWERRLVGPETQFAVDDGQVTEQDQEEGAVQVIVGGEERGANGDPLATDSYVLAKFETAMQVGLGDHIIVESPDLSEEGSPLKSPSEESDVEPEVIYNTSSSNPVVVESPDLSEEGGPLKSPSEESDVEPEVIYNTSSSNPVVVESPDLSEEGGPLKSPSEESDVEPEVIYNTSGSNHLSVDPSIFTVTTPTKSDQIESLPYDADCEDEDDVAFLTPEISPPGQSSNPFQLEPTNREEGLFLTTNYRSLESVDSLHPASVAAPAAVCLSISAKFLKRHKDFGIKREHREICRLSYRSSSSSEVSNIYGVPRQFAPDQLSCSPDLSGEEDDKVISQCLLPLLTSPPPQDSGSPLASHLCAGKEQDLSMDGLFIEITPPTSRRADHEASHISVHDVMDVPVKNTRESFGDAVIKTKKRLEDLGYDLPVKKNLQQSSASKANGGGASKDIQKMAVSCPANGKGGRKGLSVSWNAGVTNISSCDQPALAVRVSMALDSLDSNFKILAALNEEAMIDGDMDVVTTITTGVGSHSNTVVNWNNRREGWRKRSATYPLDNRSSKRMGGKWDPLDDRNPRGGQRQLGSKDQASFKEGSLRNGDGDSCVKCEGGADSDRLKSEESVGDTSVNGESGDDSNVKGEGGERGVGMITLTPKEVEEAKELVLKLMGYFS